MPHPARATVNQHGLSLVDLRLIDERLPRCRRGQRHGGGFFKINLRLERHLALFRNFNTSGPPYCCNTAAFISGPVAARTDETATTVTPITVSARKIRMRLASSPIRLHASEKICCGSSAKDLTTEDTVLL